MDLQECSLMGRRWNRSRRGQVNSRGEADLHQAMQSVVHHFAREPYALSPPLGCQT